MTATHAYLLHHPLDGETARRIQQAGCGAGIRATTLSENAASATWIPPGAGTPVCVWIVLWSEQAAESPFVRAVLEHAASGAGSRVLFVLIGPRGSARRPPALPGRVVLDLTQQPDAPDDSRLSVLWAAVNEMSAELCQPSQTAPVTPTKRRVTRSATAPSGHTEAPDAPSDADVGVRQDVLLGASAPGAAGRGDEFTARFVAYLPEQKPEVQRVLAGLGSGHAPRLDIQNVLWRSGTEVTVRLAGRTFEVSPEARTFRWEGRRMLLEFDVLVTDAAHPGAIAVLRYDVIVAGLIVATMRLDVAIAPERGIGDRRDALARTARSAFASYASSDRDRVSDRASALSSVTGMQVFMDRLSIRAGEQWRERLTREIRESDLFLLFWSSGAARSKEVEWEWRMALRERGLDVIRPQPLESPDIAPIPPELADLHFGDAFLLFHREAVR